MERPPPSAKLNFDPDPVAIVVRVFVLGNFVFVFAPAHTDFLSTERPARARAHDAVP